MIEPAADVAAFRRSVEPVNVSGLVTISPPL